MAETTPRGGWFGVGMTWILCATGVVCVAVLPIVTGVAERMGLLGVVLAGTFIAACALQLAARRPEGILVRLSTATTGAVVLVGLGALLAWIAG